ncbi:calcium-binding EF hand family protein [Musa troglodytarum]|uniref:Calcium-binding EF hand family protein n=1 Tax=Musa troglodytarum TaxID=320322 RepID=A0A9E7KJC6_9LILI|nr:calcium-binding EF hand family protein [Musa troglodytarum]
MIIQLMLKWVGRKKSTSMLLMWVAMIILILQSLMNASNPKLIHRLPKEEIRERDKDKDGKLNSREYFNGLLDLIKRYDDVYNFTHESDTSAKAPATKLISQLDHSNNGNLSEDELIPVTGDLHLSEHYFAKQHADCGISEVLVD